MSATKFFLAAAAIASATPSSAQIIAAKPDGAITTASIYALIAVTASVVGIVGGVMMILRSNKSARREAQQEADERTDKITNKIDANQRSNDDRIKTLEVRVERFVPGDVIEQKLEHLKTNRVQVELRQQEQLKELDRNVHGLCTQVAKLEERGESMAYAQIETKDLIKDLRNEMKAGFDKLAAAR